MTYLAIDLSRFSTAYVQESLVRRLRAIALVVTALIPAIIFIAAAGLGFRRTAWIVVAGLAGHGVFDFFHHGVITNPGVPVWWPGWCLAYDVTAAIYLAILIRVRRASNAR